MHRASLYILLFSVSLLAAFGIVMLASTGYYLEEGEKQTYATMNNQATWLGLAVIVATVVAFLNPEKLYEYRWWMMRYFAMDVEAQASVMRIPVRFERTYEGYRVQGGTGNPHTRLEDRTLQELRNRAEELDIEGRSSMDKDELIHAIRDHE